MTVDLTNGVPTLTLSDGGTATYDIDLSSPQTGGLVFDYTPPQVTRRRLLNVNRVNLNGINDHGCPGQRGGLFECLPVSDRVVHWSAARYSDQPIAVRYPGVSELDAGQSVELTLALGELVLLSGGTPTV